jgi:tetratricopeptide (TPR) repeat protein
MKLALIRIVVCAIILGESIFFIQVVRQEYQSKLLVKNVSIDRSIYQSVIYALPRSELIKRILINEFNSKQYNCEEILPLSDRLISSEPRSAFAYYLKSACFELEGDFISALEALSTSLTFEPLNLNYLEGKVILLTGLKNFPEAQKSLGDIFSLYGNYSRYETLRLFIQRSEKNSNYVQ